MSRFLIVGDVHGDFSFASAVCRTAQAEGITDIIQVGDFGIWDHHPDGVYFLDKLSENSEKRGVNWTFVAGNHENYDRLENYAKTDGLTDEQGMVNIRPRIRWTGRTNVWEQQGVRFGAFGGAYSIDRYARTAGTSWWPQEFPRDSDLTSLEAQVDNEPVAVLLTHDAPTSLPTWHGFMKDDLASDQSRRYMDEAYNIANPALWFHGHYHRKLHYKHFGAEVYGLGCNYDAQAYYGQPKQAALAYLDTTEATVRFSTQLN
jgi:predicted phosphodiesterase